MAVFYLAAVLATEPYHSAARLIISRVGDRADLLVAVHRWDLDLYIVGPCHRRRAVSGGKLDRSEVETETLYKVFGVRDKLFKCLVALLGKGVLHHLDLVELMSAHHSALVRAI